MSQSTAFRSIVVGLLFVLFFSSGRLVGQDSQMRVVVTPPALELEVGGKAKLEAKVLDTAGHPVKDVQVFFFSRSRRSVQVGRDGSVTALASGKFEIIARASIPGRNRPSVTVPVSVAHADLDRIEFGPAPGEIHVGVYRRMVTRVMDKAGIHRTDVQVAMSTSDASVATVDHFGNITARSPGRCTVLAKAMGLVGTKGIQVLANPVRQIELTANHDRALVDCYETGDVVHFQGVPLDGGGQPIPGLSVDYSLMAEPDDQLGESATGQIEPDGRFVAEQPGLYTVVATYGSAVARSTIRVEARNVQKKIQLVGHGEVLNVHTSDLWVWEGVDGRDYAVTGTWSADGEAYFWDVTDPSKMERVSVVKVDARTVNDVKVSEDGRICVLSREGASNRRNGIVIVDVSNPREPEILSTFDENLTGGVHNLFIHEGHVFALSAGRRYDIINIEDPRKPHKVGSFEMEEPGHSIHDVWVEDGIAYSSNWRYGVQIVDVGNGVAGGTLKAPVRMGSYAYPSGRNHAAFPYKSRDTGKFYVIAGDEAFPYGLNTSTKPTYPRGWFHVIDFTDMKNPKEVARYQVPEAGTHNLWIEGDLLYGAYYNGGLRVVDISGELLGDLYKQGREVAWYLPTHHKGVVPNAPMTWGPQPHKGYIFFTDWNSGLWAVKLVTGEG